MLKTRGALALVTPAWSRQQERRAHVRLAPLDLSTPISAKLKYGQTVTLLDVSPGGALLETSEALRPDADVVLEILGRPADETRHVVSRVLRCQVAGLDGGIRYRGACAFKRPLDHPALADASFAVTGRRENGLSLHGYDTVLRHGGVSPDALISGLREQLRHVPLVPDVPALDSAAEPSRIPAGWQRVVVRYVDDTVLRGYTNDFHPDRAHLHLCPTVACPAAERLMVPVARLKAVFFVRDLHGDPHRVDRQAFDHLPRGRRLEVTFRDGEVIVGSTMNYKPQGQGFFLQPADSRGNNVRVYVVTGAIRHLRFV